MGFKLGCGVKTKTGLVKTRQKQGLPLPNSALSFEELASLRRKLLDLVKKDGADGLKKFAAAHKRESRTNPKTCYRLNSSIYGARAVGEP